LNWLAHGFVHVRFSHDSGQLWHYGHCPVRRTVDN
jgi:hypothetical protein